MGEPEIEEFNITEEDYQNEFNINRPQFRMSKNQATYGIWAEDDSDEEQARPSFGGRRKAKQDYTAPVNFVSGGIKVGDTTTKAKNENEEDTDSEAEYDRAAMEAALQKKSGKKSSGAYTPASKFARQEGQDMGGWQKHTTGIGQKLMEKMGHVAGKGLGKKLQGISTPVEAYKRKGKAGLGAYGSERTERSLQDFPAKPDSEEEEDKNFVQKMQQWKKKDRGDNRTKKLRYSYKTAEEVIATGGKTKSRKQVQSELAKVKVIDMTGKEQRVLSGYHALSHKHDRPDDDDRPIVDAPEKKAFDMPELLHNLDLLVDMSEEAIVENSRRLRYESDMVINLEHEKNRLDELCDVEDKQINRLKDVMQIVDSCEERSKPGCDHPLTLDDCAEVFTRLQNEFYEEYKIYGLSDIAVALVFPLMKRELEGWRPLQQPNKCLESMRQWRALLEGLGTGAVDHGGDEQLDPYHRLIWELWMPYLRTAISSHWSVRDCDSVIDILEAWLPLLPEWVMANILEQLVYPRLQREVDHWNPLTDTVPIHSWLHPWLPLMGDRLETLYGPIRHKLANALTNWHPSDPSAKMILEPWARVFSQGHMDAFLVKNIVPKLEMCMQAFVINPHEQHLDAWNWLMTWIDVVPLASVVSMLEKHFFPKWLRVLSAWLSTPNPNYTEVTKWYTGWKSMFPEKLLSNLTVKDQFTKALEVMNRAVAGSHYQPGAKESVAYLATTERRQAYEPPPQPTLPMARSAMAATTVPTSFKELLERRAQEHNILFVPLPGKTHEAKQVYKFGSQQIYLDRNVVFMFDNNIFIPVSLNMLVDKSRF